MTAFCDLGHAHDDGTPKTVAPLPDHLMTLDAAPDLVGPELLAYISGHIDRHPRSLQKRIGPSELGTPCKRQLGYKLLGLDELNVRSAAWLPTIGTAVHTWLETALTAVNDSLPYDRFYLEDRVTVGQVAGEDVEGSCDVYDRVTATVIDWKVVGPSKIKAYRIGGPGEQYRRQTHLYGRGFAARGLPVAHVGVMFLPRNGELRDAYYWTEPYDEQIALDTLDTANAVHSLVTAGGVHALDLLPATDNHCGYCPFYRNGSTDLAAGCPGEAAQRTRTTSEPLGLEDLSGLVA